MIFNMKNSRVLIGLALMALLVPFASARAQTKQEQAPVAVNQKAETPSEAKPESKADAVEQLKTKVEQLQSLVEQQQRVLVEMQKRLDDVDGKTRTALVPAAARTDNASNPASPATDLRTAAVAASPTATTVSTTATAAGQTKPAEKPVAGWDKNHAFLRSADGSRGAHMS